MAALDPRTIAGQGIGAGPRLTAVQGLWPLDEEAADDEQADTAFGPHRRRAWRPDPLLDPLPPRKRPRRRRREELVLISK